MTPTTSFLFDGNQPLLEKQGSTTTATYTYGNALLRKDMEFPLFDGQGSERTVTANNQSVQGTISYDAFGQTNATTGSSTNAYMFGATSGYRSDGDSGLILVGCRYYDPQVDRFVTRDTYLDQHPYIYCNGDPVNYVDPSGHFFWFLVAVAALLLLDGCASEKPRPLPVPGPVTPVLPPLGPTPGEQKGRQDGMGTDIGNNMSRRIKQMDKEDGNDGLH